MKLTADSVSGRKARNQTRVTSPADTMLDICIAAIISCQISKKKKKKKMDVQPQYALLCDFAGLHEKQLNVEKEIKS